MTDTSPKMEAKFRRMLLRRSGAERLKMGCSMHAATQAMVRASILHREPAASQAALRRNFFLRFYAQDFDASTLKRILARLEKTVSEAEIDTALKKARGKGRLRKVFR